MFGMTVLAHVKGYRVTPEGDVMTPTGNTRKFCLTPDGRKSFTMHVPGQGRAYPVLVHQLAAVQKFGMEAVKAAYCIRHLDGDPGNNHPDNLALGTASQNAMDRTPADRSAHAKKASEVLARKDWAAIDADRAEGMGYGRLAKKHGVSKGTLSYRYSKSGKCRRLENR